MPHIVCVGAVYMDTILSVPHFPEEDTKLRATNLLRRRGGNTANTLEVLSQLLPPDNFDAETSTYATELSLLTVLPDQNSPDTKTVISSLPDVSTRLFQYRAGQQIAASSYIIQSAANLTRTIVSANPLEEMTVQEFKDAIEPLVALEDEVWIHFEGRIPQVLYQCVWWLREKYGYYGKVMVSVECEKPDRVGLKEVAAIADVVFYSRIWAEAHFTPSADVPTVSPEAFLSSQLQFTQPTATLICTWGSDGAFAFRKSPTSEPLTASAPGWKPSRSEFGTVPLPVDTVGAGDTFVAGTLYGWVQQKGWGINERLAFANELAGRKVYRQGFDGVGDDIRGSEVWGEKMLV